MLSQRISECLHSPAVAKFMQSQSLKESVNIVRWIRDYLVQKKNLCISFHFHYSFNPCKWELVLFIICKESYNFAEWNSIFFFLLFLLLEVMYICSISPARFSTSCICCCQKHCKCHFCRSIKLTCACPVTCEVQDLE